MHTLIPITRLRSIISISLILIPLNLKATSQNSLKPRVIVLTDVSTWETDDSESLVRLLVHADLLEIEGLVYTTGWSLDKTRDDFFDLIHVAINAYEKDLPNLQKRSNQADFKADESRQRVGYWPSAGYLRSRTVFGSKNRGVIFIGEGNDSPGSDLIIRMADEKDERPVWVLAWGGANTLAQAIWRVKQDRNAEQFQKFLQKVRLYTITDQDRGYQAGTPYDISSHQWMRREFSDDLLFLWDESAWLYQNGTGKSNWDQYEAHIQNHGALGQVYPKYKYGVEGDTPSFLYVLPNGLNDPEYPGYGGWGGYFVRALSPDGETYAFTNHSGVETHTISRRYEEYFYPAIFNNFAARMDWAKEGTGNRNPVVIINGDRSMANISLSPKPGTSILLNASKSYDPDKDRLSYSWWVLTEAGSYEKDIKISADKSDRVNVEIPADAAGKTFHIICEVTDNGTHALTGYRRIIVQPKK